MNSFLKQELGGAFKKSFILLLAFLASLFVAYEYRGTYIKNPTLQELQVKKFQKVFNKKEKELNAITDEMEKLFEAHADSNALRNSLFSFNGRYNKKGYIFYIYKNDTLAFWSNNHSEIPEILTPGLFGNKMADLGNAYYYSVVQVVDEYKIIGLAKIKNDYSIENEYLQNSFQDDFHIGSRVGLTIGHCIGCAGIHNLDNQRVFSLDFSVPSDEMPGYIRAYMFIVLLCLVIWCLFLFIFLKNIKDKHIRNWVLGISMILMVILRLALMIFTEEGLKNLKLFSPNLFATSDFLSSLGHLVAHVGFFVFLAILAHEFFSFRVPENKRGNRAPAGRYILFSGLMAVYIMYALLTGVIITLIQNSNISFQIYKVLDTNVFTFIALATTGIFYLAIIILYDKLLMVVKPVFQPGQIIRMVSYSFIVPLLTGLLVFPGNLVFMLHIIPAILLISYFRLYNGYYNISGIIVLALLFSIFSGFLIIKEADRKNFANKKVLAVNLSTEHDYIAEMLLEKISDRITKDERLTALVTESGTENADIRNYITSRYFGGYLNKYNIQVIVCGPQDSIFIQPDNRMFHCYGFFDEYIRNYGIKVPDTEFYFMNTVSGRIGYLGVLLLFNENLKDEFILYIELQAKYTPTELGYPELLLGRGHDRASVLGGFSYAKYYKNELIAQSGPFQYPLKGHFNRAPGITGLELEGHRHLLYYPDADNLIIVSNPLLLPSDWLYTFSYLLLFYIGIVMCVLAIFRLNSFRLLIVPTFRNKIQLSMMMVLFISFALIGGLTIYLSITRYKQKYNEFISEKLQSIYVELEHKLEFEDGLGSYWASPQYENLDELLKKFSNVFFTDINLFDSSGNILASSRPEIFINRLQGSKMNAQAFFQLFELNRSELIQIENIGKLEYLSGYVPFFNHQGKLLAYLNLPYFTRQKELTHEVSNLVITIINIYVLLFLITSGLALLMSEQITRPLRLIQQSFRQVKLDRVNDPILYSGDDEIADLVNEYNRMVAELSVSAERLAQTEREMAWREMAKQIAHEIKNPLTPMKLSIQQLQKAMGDKAENWQEMFQKVSVSLIEQINALTSIANEFSNFAKMPHARNEKVNIIEKINNTVGLFRQSENIQFVTDFKGAGEIPIWADKEQVLRVFVNLIKNAVQAIPEGRQGTVAIEAITDIQKSRVEVSISDNGKGIAPDIRGKLFRPNFTTKSGGMGMGLAIVKKIIETTGGTITFTTEMGKGASFIIVWPLFKE